MDIKTLISEYEARHSTISRAMLSGDYNIGFNAGISTATVQIISDLKELESALYNIAYNQALEDAANVVESDCHVAQGYCNTVHTVKQDINSLKKQ